MQGLLGKAWDDELEPFRYAGDGAPVRWLHQVVCSPCAIDHVYVVSSHRVGCG